MTEQILSVGRQRDGGFTDECSFTKLLMEQKLLPYAEMPVWMLWMHVMARHDCQYDLRLVDCNDKLRKYLVCCLTVTYACNYLIYMDSLNWI